MSALVWTSETKPAEYVPEQYARCRSCGYERVVGSGPCGEPCI